MNPTAAPAPPDERLARIGVVTRVLKRPDTGAFIGAVAVFILFAYTARGVNWAGDFGVWSSWLNTAAYDGIVAVPVALLMIGGEFDLSSGVMIGSSGLLLGILTTQADWNIWPAIVVVILFGMAIGFLNGFTVVKTKLPSFIVTLGTFFMLRGLNAGGTIKITGGVSINDIDKAPGFDFAHKFFASEVGRQYGFERRELWWLGFTRRRGVGAGADPLSATGSSARAATPWQHATSASPSHGRRSSLFMTTSAVAALMGIMTAVSLRGMQSNEGIGREFMFIIGAVVGGCLLTGGYGSVIGAVFGAAIIGMAQIGIISSGWDSNWVYFFEGVVLVAAVMLNTAIRRARGASEVTTAETERSSAHICSQLEHISKYFGNVLALKDVSAARQRRRGDMHPGRQRRRQVDADQDPLRRAPARRGQRASGRRRVHFSSPRDARHAGIATVYQDLAMVPLMSIWRNFFLGEEPTKGRGPCQPLRHRLRQEDGPRADGADGHRHPRPRPARRHAVGRRAAGGRDRPRDLLRRAGADPGRADVRARRQAGGSRPPLHRASGRARAWALSSSRTTLTTPTRSVTTSCCSTAAA